MTLRPQTVSINFEGGVHSHDVDEFLLEPPVVEYSENVHTEKAGVAIKRNGFDSLGTAYTGGGRPYLLHSQNDKLYAFTDEGARVHNNGSWSTLNTTAYMGVQEVACETPPLRGQTNYSCVKVTGGYLVAFDVLQQGTTDNIVSTLFTHVIVQAFDDYGKFLWQRRIGFANTARLVETDGVGAAALFYRSSDALFSFQALYHAVISINNPDIFFGVDTGIRTTHEPRSTSYSTGVAPRLSQGLNYSARFQVAYDPTSKNHFIYYLKTDGSTVVAKMTGGVIVDEVEITATTDEVDPLAIAIGPDGAYLRVLYTYFTTSGFNGVSMVRVRLSDLLPTATVPIVAETTGVFRQERMYTHGSLCTAYHSDGTAYTIIGAFTPGWAVGDPVAADQTDKFEHVRYASVGTYVWVYNETDGTLGNMQAKIGHRLTTNFVFQDDKWYAGIQQWGNYDAFIDKTADIALKFNQLKYTPALKPVTTALCSFDDSGSFTEVRPIAAIDAGVSQHTEYIESEMSTHLSTLALDGDDFLITNRVVVAPGTYTYYVDNTDAPAIDHRDSELDAPAETFGRVTRVTKATNLENQIYGSPFGDGISISTALPIWFDGDHFSEAAVLDSPEILRIEDVGSEDEGLPMPPQAYEIVNGLHDGQWRQFQVVYGFTDVAGNVHRSAPSKAVWVARLDNDDAGSPYRGETVTVHVTPPLSIMPDNREYFLELYVSFGETEEPQLISTTTYTTNGALTGASIVSQVTREHPTGAVDEIRMHTPPVYTSGGELAADPFPAWQKSVLTSRRMWWLDPVNKGSVGYTKLFQEFIAPETNGVLRLSLGDERNLTAIGRLDDKVAVFEPNAIHVIYGDGPDNNGEGQDFEVHYINSGVGCSDHQSLVETPNGLVFYYRDRGFYILKRNLQVEFIGEPIKDISHNINVNSAQLVPKYGEARFLCSLSYLQPPEFGRDPDLTQIARPPRPRFRNNLPTDGALAYDYVKNEWSVYSNYEGRAATIHLGEYTRALSDWDVWQENEGYVDPTGDNRILIRTPWIKLGNLQDYERLWYVNFIGRYFSSLRDATPVPGDPKRSYEAGDIKITAWYDHEWENPQEKVYAVQDFPFYHASGTDDPRRAERLQFRFSPEQGRGMCQAIKFQIEEVNSTSHSEEYDFVLGAGFEITAADLMFGVGTKSTHRYVGDRVRR